MNLIINKKNINLHIDKTFSCDIIWAQRKGRVKGRKLDSDDWRNY